MLQKKIASKKKTKDNKGKSFRIQNSRKLYIPYYFMVIVLLSIVGYLRYNNLPINKLTLILVGIFILFVIKVTEIHRFSNSYLADHKSLTHTSGIFSKRIKSMDLFAISDIDIQQTFWQRIWGFEDIHISLFSDTSSLIVRNINNPTKFGNFIENMMSTKRKECDEW
tara:strand:- start:2916 stop:3416 length:501 start_codon:yes stop_codon:yes gene_type:complete